MAGRPSGGHAASFGRQCASAGPFTPVDGGAGAQDQGFEALSRGQGLTGRQKVVEDSGGGAVVPFDSVSTVAMWSVLATAPSGRGIRRLRDGLADAEWETVRGVEEELPDSI